MRKVLTGVGALTLAAFSAAVAVAATCHTSATAMHAMPKCTSASGPVVWYVPSAKTYYAKGSSRFGMGTGMYVCRATALTHGAKLGSAAGGTATGTPMPRASHLGRARARPKQAAT